MITGYRDKRTRDFAAGKRVKAFSGIERSARLKLDRLEAAVLLADLAACPETASKRSGENVKASIVFASTTNGGYASSGRTSPQDR
jgi:plasmid maintenance system killer protein